MVYGGQLTGQVMEEVNSKYLTQNVRWNFVMRT